MRVRLAKSLIAFAWLSVAYTAVATYLALWRHSGPTWVPWVAIPAVLIAILVGAIGAVLAPPQLSRKGAWASAAASGLFVLPALFLGLGLLIAVVAAR